MFFQALARAVYSLPDTLIIDSIFSGLDQKTIALISSRLFSKNGHFNTAGRSVVMATNTCAPTIESLIVLVDKKLDHMLRYASIIIVLDEGRIVDNGSYEELRHRMPEIMLSSQMTQDIAPVFSEDEDSSQPLLKGEKAINTAKATTSEALDMLRQQGSWSVYGYYFRSAGYGSLALWAVAVLIECFGSSFISISTPLLTSSSSASYRILY